MFLLPRAVHLLAEVRLPPFSGPVAIAYFVGHKSNNSGIVPKYIGKLRACSGRSRQIVSPHYADVMAFTCFERYVALAGDQIPGHAGPWPEEQNGEYESGLVRIDSQLWRTRTARVTPTKPGAFVAVWQRDELGDTQPFESSGEVAGLLVFVQDGELFGVFRFTSAHLESLGVTSSAAHPGKRGFRLYPSWCTGLNPQAKRTQAAQAAAFVLLRA